MKKFYTLLSALLLAGLSAFSQFDVTFEVDMTNETVDANGVHVAGSFQGWSPSGTPLTDMGNGMWSVTLSLEAGNYEFKFLNGNDWPFEETVPDACRVNLTGNTNRQIEVTGDQTYSVCFGSCAACGDYTVRLIVDMSLEAGVAPQGVHVAGNFQGWDPSSTELLDSDGDLKYEVIYSFDPASLAGDGGNLVWKYVNGDSWDLPNENISGDCGDGGGNRTLALTEANTVIGPFCYNTCGTCVAPTPVTLRVNMALETVSPNGVHVAGAFQGWSPGADELTDPDADGIYEITLEMQPGTYEYKFVNGNDWSGADNDNESVPGACNVNGNRVIEVGTDPITVEYCYNQCTAECVSDPDPADITFQVNMADVVVDAEGVWMIAGFTTPQWQAGAVQMSDDDADGIYTVTLNVSGSAEIQYKFCNGDPYPGGAIDETVSESYDFTVGLCGAPNGVGGWNRTHVRSGVAETLDVVCFNSCVNCGDNVIEGDALEFNIFPNPANEQISLSGNMTGLTQVVITDISGKVVMDVTYNATATVYDLNISNVKSGVYAIAVLNNGVLANRMFVKK
ncbi:MAG: hypothetical protein RL226_187 [Bacteroidota bacterium]|jgi:hypothetical protein